jgi:membrane-associated phospholipid phosphatase
MSWYEPFAALTNRYNVSLAVGAGVSGVIVLLARRDGGSALLFPLAALTRPLLDVAKAAVDRPRPTVFETRADFGDSSFPSGHVMTAVAFFGLWFVLAPLLVPERLVVPIRLVAIGVIGMHAVGRMWAGVHWFSDTYGGVVWMGAALCALMAVRGLLNKQNAHPRAREDARL